MKDTLATGIRRSARHVVTADMSPPHLPSKVLSTPSMIQLIEATCLATAQEHLDRDETTVGMHVCVSHSTSVAAGEEIEVRAN
jgi:predicted thioesterase